MQNINPLRKVALIGGTGYLIIFVTGIFANFFVLESLVDANNAKATLENLVTNTTQLKIGILAFLTMVIFDVVLTWALYIILKAVNKNIALFSAWFRLVNCVIFAVALFHLFDVLSLTSNASLQSLLSQIELEVAVTRALSSFNYTWLIGLVFFGLHLLVTGYLTILSGYIPKFIGVLLLIAGAGYLVDSAAQFMLSNYNDYADIFALVVILPGVVGELSLTFWLLLKGGKQVNNPNTETPIRLMAQA